MHNHIIWTEEMIGYLKSHADLSGDEIGRKIGVSAHSVNKKFKELGYYRPKHGVANTYQWTPEREAYLREHYPTDATCDVAEALGTCYGTVKKRADLLGLVKAESYDKKAFHSRWCKDYKHNIRRIAV